MKIVHMIAVVLVVVSAINVGLTALGYNVLGMLLGGIPQLAMILSLLIGLSGLYILFKHKGTCTECTTGGVGSM